MSGWHTRAAPAKLNLALVVGPLRPNGKHEVVTVLERLALADTVAVRPATTTRVTGFAEDTLVRDALEAVTRVAGGEARFEARIEKRIPVAAGLGGGSSDAAAAMLVANELLGGRIAPARLVEIAATLGADVPFFLHDGPRLATGDGTMLAPVTIPRDYTVLLALPGGAAKPSTGDVYAAFDARHGDRGFDGRQETLHRALGALRSARDLASLPPNDLASSSLAAELHRLGSFRADVTGAGPVVYGLFADQVRASHAASALEGVTTWITTPR